MRRMVAVIELGVIIMMYVRWKDILPLFRNYLQQQLPAKAYVPQFVTSSVDRLRVRVLGSASAARELGPQSIAQERKLKRLEDAGVLPAAHEPVGAQPVANDNDPSGLVG